MLVMQEGDSLFGGLPIIHITYQQYKANPSAYHDPNVIVHITGYPTAGNLPADYVGYDSNLNMEDIGNIATKAIAKVEPSDTALYLHNVGTGFINKDGNYCLTDVQISVGGTITLGTNCHVVDGGISSKLTYREIVSTSLSSSVADNLAVLKNYFDTLTNEQKKDCYIMENASTYRIMVSDGRFSTQIMYSNGTTHIITISLNAREMRDVTIAVNGTLTYTNLSSNANSSTFKLMARH